MFCLLFLYFPVNFPFSSSGHHALPGFKHLSVGRSCQLVWLGDVVGIEDKARSCHVLSLLRYHKCFFMGSCVLQSHVKMTPSYYIFQIIYVFFCIVLYKSCCSPRQVLVRNTFCAACSLVLMVKIWASLRFATFQYFILFFFYNFYLF